MTAPEQQATGAPESLRWILPAGDHAKAWDRAAHWVHANSHPIHLTEDPCHDCWRTAAYAVKGAVLAGYRPQPKQQAAPVQPPADLRQRVVQALRDAAYDCDGHCGLDEQECDAQHPIQVAALHHGQVASVCGDIDDLAEVAAAQVEPELAALREQLAAAEQRAQDWEQARDAEVLTTARVFDEYYRRWQSTIVEARRQAHRADTAELSLAQAMAWAHATIYHHGGPACPYPDTCPAAAPTT